MPPDVSDTAILLVSHGSREVAHSIGAERLSAMLSGKLGRPVSLAYLQTRQPSVQTVLESLLQGHRQICLLPLFVFEGRHVTEDLPKIVGFLQNAHPKASIRMAHALGADRLLADLARRKLLESCQKKGRGKDVSKDVSLEKKSACIYLAHGSKEPAVQEIFFRQAELFFSSTFPLPNCTIRRAAFLGLSPPFLPDLLEELYRAGVRLAFVALHLLFEGKIREKAELVLQNFCVLHPDFSFVLSTPFGADEAVAELLAKRFWASF